MAAEATTKGALAHDDWRRWLHPGDEVTWNDRCGMGIRTGRILKIDYTGSGDTARVTWLDGTRSELALEELS